MQAGAFLSEAPVIILLTILWIQNQPPLSIGRMWAKFNKEYAPEIQRVDCQTPENANLNREICVLHAGTQKILRP
jgi:hypothetical protein